MTRAREKEDFDDMMHLTLNLLRCDSWAANKLKNRFQFLFVDEYQVFCARERARAILPSLFLKIFLASSMLSHPTTRLDFFSCS